MAGFARLQARIFRDMMPIRGPHTYELDDDGVRFTSPVAESRFEWHLVTRCVRTRAGLLFLSGKAPIMTLPARALDDDALERIGRLLERRGIRRKTLS